MTRYYPRNNRRKARNYGKYITRIVKREQLRAAETKETEEVWYQGGMLHCTIYSTQLLTQMNQSIQDTGRIGSEVYLRGFKFNIVANTPIGSSPCWYDVYVVRTTPEFTQANIASLQFLKNRADADSYINTKLDKVKVLYHRRLQVTPAFSTQSGMAATKHWEPINSKHVFETANSDNGLYYNYFLICRAYIVGGVVDTTNSGNMEVNIRTYFKDM